MNVLPKNLISLHCSEENLRVESFAAIRANKELLQHFRLIDLAMGLCNLMRMLETSEEDQNVIKLLCTRMFNAFASSIKLITGGYHQNSALIMRDIMETVFLVDYFRTNPQKITLWLNANKQEEKKPFKPVEIRKALEARDGHNNKNRKTLYTMLSDLAAHPNRMCMALLTPRGEEVPYIGPFFNAGLLREGLEQMALLASEVGEIIDAFLPTDWHKDYRKEFAEAQKQWIKKFGPRIEAQRKRLQQ